MHKVAKWIRKQETHLRTKDIHRLKVKGWKKIFHENGNKKAGEKYLHLVK